jgi:hypothetical protein
MLVALRMELLMGLWMELLTMWEIGLMCKWDTQGNNNSNAQEMQNRTMSTSHHHKCYSSVQP